MKERGLALVALLIASSPWQLYSQTPRWESLDGPHVPENRMHIRYSDGDRRFVGSGTGTYRTTDGGRTWATVGTALAPYLTYFQSPRGVLFAWEALLDLTPYSHSYHINYLYRSSDRGQHWTASWGARLKDGIYYPEGYATFWNGIAFGGGDTVYQTYSTYYYADGSGSSYVLQSTDAGITWTTMLRTSNDYGSGYGGIYTQPNNIFVRKNFGMAMGYDMRRSSDGGVTWQTITADFVMFHPPNNLLRVRRDNLGQGVFSAKTYIELSTDEGANWTTNLTADSGFTSLVSDDVAILFVLRNPGYEIFRSTDAGHSWQSLGYGPTDDHFTSIKYYGNTHQVATTVSGSLYRSTDYGSSWVRILDDEGQPLKGAVQPASDSLFVVADSIGNWLESDDAGLSWRFISRPFGTMIASLLCVPSGSLFAGSMTSLSRKVEGEPWVASLSGPTPYSPGTMSKIEGPVWSLFYRAGPLFLASSGQWAENSVSHVAVTYGLDTSIAPSVGAWVLGGNMVNQYYEDCRSIYATTGGVIILAWGYSILRITDPRSGYYTPVGPSGPPNSWSAIVEDSSHALWAANDSLGVYRSLDTGLTWNASHAGLTNLHVLSLAVAPSGEIFAGTRGGGVFRSTDNGNSWASAGLTTDTVQALLAGRESIIYAGTSEGVSSSTDGGVTWSDISLGLTMKDIHALTQGPDGTVYCGTWGDGVYRLVGTPIQDAAETEMLVPLTFGLQQNYPNPFNPKTVIRSQTPVASNVRIVIYDVLGREVKVLVNERRVAGYYEDSFDGSGLASGVYIYHLVAGTCAQSRKMILMK